MLNRLKRLIARRPAPRELCRRLRHWAGQQRTQNYLKAVLSCSISSILVFIAPVRRRLGRLYFQMVLTTAMAHGGTTVGTNLETQMQQLLFCGLTSSYILLIQLVVVGLNRPGINFDVAASITHAVALAVFCFFAASIYTYVPRLGIPLKINATVVYLAFTVYPAERSYVVLPLPSSIYAQLIGAAVSTLVNVFVLPSTSGRDLLSRLRRLFGEAAACCEYFEESIADLGKRDQVSARAAEMQRKLHFEAEQLGQAVGGARYETTIDRFSQLDYHYIFVAAAELSSSFASMCLPLSVDRRFYYRLQNPQAKMKFGTMTDPQSRTSLETAGESSASLHTMGNSVSVQRSLRELADHHLRMEKKTMGAAQAIKPIKKQLHLHRLVLTLLHDRAESMEHRSPSKSLFDLAARSIKSIYTKTHSGFSTQASVDVDIEATAEAPEYSVLEPLNLEQLAQVVDYHSEWFEREETRYIGLIMPYDPDDDHVTHEKNVLLLSFIGILRENAVCLSKLLRTLHKINTSRPDYVQVWFPRLSWPWLFHAKVEDANENDSEPRGDEWELENAFEGDEGPDEESLSALDSESGSEVNEHQQLRRHSIIRQQTETEAVYELVDNPYARVLRVVIDWSRRPRTRYAFKFTLTMMVWAVWTYIRPLHNFFVSYNGQWGLTCISTVFGVTIGSTFLAGFSRVLGSSLSGAWAIVAWRASRNGSTAYLPCFCVIVYFVIALYVGFFVPKMSSVAPIMVVSLASVLFSAYNTPGGRQGTSLGWKHVVVNIIAIVFTFAVSSLFMPHKARTALRLRLADIIRLNSLLVQSINHMHIARAEFPQVYRAERQRVYELVNRSRVLLAKCRNLLPAAAREPGVHERFHADAHRHLIETLQLQLEWELYSYFTHRTHSSPVLRTLIRQLMPMREDIVGAKSVFNSMLASALSARSRLPAYLPDISTARKHFVAHVQPMLNGIYTRSFDITYLARWDVGIWHLIATQAELCYAVRAIVGSETDCWPEVVGFMLDTLETAPPARLKDEVETSGQWFSRLPKYYSANIGSA